MRQRGAGLGSDFLARKMRLQTIHRRIGGGHRPTAEELATACDVSTKTIYRDIEILRKLGAPIELSGANKGYVYTDASFRLPAPMLTSRELFAVAIAQRAVVSYAGTPLEKHLDEALEKIIAWVPEKDLRNVSFAADRVYFADLPSPSIPADIWSLIHEALADCVTLDMRYYSALSGKETRRRIDPYALIVRGRDWYLLAHVHDVGGQLMFYLPRIRELSATDTTFQRSKSLDVEAALRRGFNALPGMAKKNVAVKLRFASDVADVALERKWTEHQTEQRDAKGRQIVSFTVREDVLFEVARQVMRWAPYVEVLAPRSLRSNVALIAEKTLAAHR